MKSTVRLMVLATLSACSSGSDGQGRDGRTDDTGDTETPPPGVSMIHVNEIMALNETGHTDESGSHPDWIELYNPNDADVDLSGWWLSDDVEDPFKSQIPDGVVIPAMGYLVFFADDDPDEGPLHLVFGLDQLGAEDVALFGPNVLDNPLVDAVEDMDIQYPDVSIARMPDGGPTWEDDDTPTPGTSNN